MDPWPGVPRTRSRRQAMPFSATLTVMWRVPSGLIVDQPPDSVRTYFAPTASQCSSIMYSAPQ